MTQNKNLFLFLKDYLASKKIRPCLLVGDGAICFYRSGFRPTNFQALRFPEEKRTRHSNVVSDLLTMVWTKGRKRPKRVINQMETESGKEKRKGTSFVYPKERMDGWLVRKPLKRPEKKVFFGSHLHTWSHLGPFLKVCRIFFPQK